MLPATFILDTPAKLDRCVRRIEKLPMDGRIWDVTIKPWQPRRTLQQNARLHLLFQKVALETGSDIESVKLGYKSLFLAGKKSTFNGQAVIVYPKTSKMNKKQLTSFMDQCETHAITELGVLLGR